MKISNDVFKATHKNEFQAMCFSDKYTSFFFFFFINQRVHEPHNLQSTQTSSICNLSAYKILAVYAKVDESKEV